jgi:hypothetical protein
MMTPKNKAEALINSYIFILMNEDTECGNEILCTSIAKQCALISVDEISKHCYEVMKPFWEEVKQEIENL